MKTSVSILSLKEKDRIKEIESYNPDYIHIDVMDGLFVPNVSFPYDEIKPYLNNYNYDVHLMVNNPIKYIDDFKNINPKYITFHIEIGNTIDYINYLKNLNIKVGLAINPDTDISTLYPYLDKVDLVLIMSVFPGKGGQEFIMSSIDKIDDLYNYRLNNNLDFIISVDGGVNKDTRRYLDKCDMVVSGSYVVNNENITDAIDVLRGVK